MYTLLLFLTIGGLSACGEVHFEDSKSNLEGRGTPAQHRPEHALDVAEWLGLGEGMNYWP